MRRDRWRGSNDATIQQRSPAVRPSEVERGAVLAGPYVCAGERNGWAALDVTGEIEAFSTPEREQTRSTIIDGGARQLFVDLRKLDLMGSTGRGTLCAALLS